MPAVGYRPEGSEGDEVEQRTAREHTLTLLRERIVAFAASRSWGNAAEDLAQEVLVVLHEKYRGVTAIEELLPLAFQILRFKMLGARRKSLRRGEHLELPVEEI